MRDTHRLTTTLAELGDLLGAMTRKRIRAGYAPEDSYTITQGAPYGAVDPGASAIAGRIGRGLATWEARAEASGTVLELWARDDAGAQTAELCAALLAELRRRGMLDGQAPGECAAIPPDQGGRPTRADDKQRRTKLLNAINYRKQLRGNNPKKAAKLTHWNDYRTAAIWVTEVENLTAEEIEALDLGEFLKLE